MRQAAKLRNQTAVDRLPKIFPGEKRYKVGDVPTLYLYCKGKNKRFEQRIRFEGKEVNRSLGPHPVVTLEEAEEKALVNRRRVRQGLEPLRAFADSTIPTMADALETVIANRRHGWKPDGTSEAEWRRCMDMYGASLLPARVDRVGRDAILACLGVNEPNGIWKNRHQSAKRLLNQVNACLEWSIANNHRKDVSPIPSILEELAEPLHEPKKRAALHYSKIAAGLRVIAETPGSWSTLACLRFVALTACRTKEARFAKWEDVDFDAEALTIPYTEHKANKTYRIPLSKQTMEIIREAEAKRVNDYIFPGERGDCIGRITPGQTLKKTGLQCTPHGFRASFRTWVAECTDYPEDLSELCISHDKSSRVQRAYQRSDRLEKRREIMQEWADYVT